MSEPLAISVKSLGKIYSDGWLRGKKFSALNQVTFDVNQGEIFGLLGPNGAGKTTFLKILLGIIRKSSGEAMMLGQPAGSVAGRQQVGYLPEQLRIPQHMTGYTALEYYGNLSNVPTSAVREKRSELLDLVGLGVRGAEPVKKYSKGMRQRLGLAQALLHEPKLIVLDEPTDGLDPGARADMRNIIRKLKQQGVTIFLNSHILQEVELICDRVAILHRGKLRYCGAVNEIGSFVESISGTTGSASVVIEIDASAGDVEELAKAVGATLSVSEVGRVQLILPPDQQQVDTAIDQVRNQQISIVEVRKREVSLEDAFLQIVDTAD